MTRLHLYILGFLLNVVIFQNYVLSASIGREESINITTYKTLPLASKKEQYPRATETRIMNMDDFNRIFPDVDGDIDAIPYVGRMEMKYVVGSCCSKRRATYSGSGVLIGQDSHGNFEGLTALHNFYDNSRYFNKQAKYAFFEIGEHKGRNRANNEVLIYPNDHQGLFLEKSSYVQLL